MRKCRICGSSLEGKRAHAKYCSQVCCNKGNHTHPKAAAYARKYRARLRKFRKFEDTVRGQALAMGFRSGFERTLAASLQKRKIKFGYETLQLPYTIDHVYSPDFILPNGILIEAKGKLTPQDRSKMIAVKKHHPDLDIRFVFMRGENKLTAKSKTTYMMWAAKNGFPAADEEIPDEWLK